MVGSLDKHGIFSATRTVQDIIDTALQLRASDVHLEPTDLGLRVRYRCDGMLHDGTMLPREHALRITTRIKVVAKLDIGEKRTPQDGKFVVAGRHGHIDIRVATFPALYGEKIVLRILDATQGIRSLEQLGCREHLATAIRELIRRPQGLFIVTGPTGSGKTTTLYTLLSYLSSSEKNSVTLEDPIEYTVPGVTQGHIRSDIGFGFAEGIRALLRQDPDIIMVGEIRDVETARAAIRAALTGHIVLSTLHTTDAVSAVTRLIDMGVERFLLNAVLTGVLAQRLIRILCGACKKDAADGRYLPGSCDACNMTGYRSRLGIFECFVMTPETRRLLVEEDASYEKLLSCAREQGMRTMHEDGRTRIAEGVTTEAELLRVL